MAITLRDALVETYQHWKREFPSAWRSIIRDVELDGADVDDGLILNPWVPIFPTTSEGPAILGAPKFSHVFRAFQDIRPEDVRAVIVGQDPYPDVAKATGLSFEQGNLRDWVGKSGSVAKSLKRIIQAAAATDEDNERYLGNRGWSNLVNDLQRDQIDARDPQEFFEASREQGVLWLNTTLSISLFRGADEHNHQPGHRAFWAPLVGEILDYLAQREAPSVFVLWGGWARDLRPRLERSADSAGTAESLGIVEAGHPVTANFLRARPLLSVNEQLERLGMEPIDWL